MHFYKCNTVEDVFAYKVVKSIRFDWIPILLLSVCECKCTFVWVFTGFCYFYIETIDMK